MPSTSRSSTTTRRPYGHYNACPGSSLRLARYFGTSDRFWLNLQASYDLDVEREKLGERLEAEVLPRAS